MSELTVLDTDLVIRPMNERDADAVLAGFASLSAESLRHRFFTPVPRLTPAQREDLVRVDPPNRMVLLAVEPGTGRVVGGARFLRRPEDPTTAEVAVTVGDCWQHHGLGQLLLRRLRAIALTQGVEHFTGHVQVDNVPARAMLRHAGAKVALDEPGTLAFDVALHGRAA